MGLTPQEKTHLQRDMLDTVKSFQKFWGAGKMADAAQCAHDLERMSIDPKDWLAQFPTK